MDAAADLQVGGEALVRGAAQQQLDRPAEEGRGHLVDLKHPLRVRVEQRDGQRRGLDDALQRGLRLRDAHLGLAAAFDVQQCKGDLRAGGAAAGEHRVADHPELAPVARLQPAFEGVGAAFGQRVQVVGAAQRVFGLGRRHGGDRFADEVRQVAGEHAPRRAVHPLDAAVADGDDAHQHRIEDGARAPGLAQQFLARPVALLDVDIGADAPGLFVGLVDQPLRHLHPQQAAVAAAQLTLTVVAALLAQHAQFFLLLAQVGLGVAVPVRPGPARPAPNRHSR